MSALPPESSAPGAGDPLGIRYPSTARIWNYHLRGKDNFEPDRQAAAAVNELFRDMGVPSPGDTAVETRHLLQRMVDYMLGQGVRQFLDLGNPRVRQLLDFGQPVGIIFICMLHCLWDEEDPWGWCGSSGTRWCRAATWR